MAHLDNDRLNDTVTLADGSTATLREVLDGNLRQSDYTKKTTALAQERQSLEAQLKAAQEEATKFANFKKALQDNPLEITRGLQEKFGILPENKPSVSAETDQNDNGNPGTPDTNTVLLNELQEMKRQIQAMAAGSQMDKAFSEVSSKFPDVDKKALAEFAARTGITDLEIAYKAMNFDTLQASVVSGDAERKQGLLDSALANYTSSVVTALPASSSSGVATKDYATTHDATAAALREIGLPS